MASVSSEFSALFGRFEHALKREGFLKAGRRDAQADWVGFAKALGPPFYQEIVERQLAETLIKEPPGRLLNEGLIWDRPEAVLSNTVELFERGVCRVRNSLVHGEKLVGDPAQRDRDIVLIRDALNVLQAASDRVPGVSGRLAP